MKNSQKQFRKRGSVKNSDLISVFWQVLNYVKQLSVEFEKLFHEGEINVKMPLVKPAYMDVIIVNLAKLFGNLRCDEFGLRKLKNITSEECKKEIEDIEKNHKEIIEKIISNRNMIIVHVDRNFSELCFSDKHIKKIEKNFNTNLSEIPRAGSKSKERYDPDDFRDNLPEIKNILDKADKVWGETLMFNYSKK
ncbi:MAG: hypothetical protein Q8Q48_04370 [Candidatus Staskawiczbacteria bacterium]|nr:hypothetical protein [Candidatus Staskawiczbacteria bacterium]